MAGGLVLGLASNGSAAPGGVRLLPSGPSRVHFVVDVPTPVFERVSAAGAPESFRVVLEGYGSRAMPEGYALPARVIQVAVPPRGEVRVRGSSVETRTREAIDLALMPGDARDPEEARLEREARIASRGARPPSHVELLDVSWMRNQRVARIAILPAAYETSKRRLSVSGPVDVEVEFEAAPPAGPPAEPSDPFEGVYRSVLVNYEQGKSWRRAAALRSLIGREAPSISVSPAGSFDTTNVFVGRNWVKIAITQTGFYRVELGQLRNLDPFSGNEPSIDSLRLFTWPGFPVLSEVEFCDDCDYREVAMEVLDAGDDGLFTNGSDAIQFFALGPSDWADLYDPTLPDTLFINNPYETKSYYYLTVSTAAQPLPGRFRRIEPVSGALPGGAGATTPATFEARVHYEQDTPSEYFPHLSPRNTTFFWEKWFWRSINLGGTFSVSADVPGIDTTQAAQLRMRLWGVRVGGACALPLPPQHIVDLAMNGAPVGSFAWDGNTGYTIDTPVTGLRSSTNSVRTTVGTPPSCTNRVDQVAMAWFDIFYRRHFEPVGGVLTFDSPAGGGDFVYRIAPFERSRTSPPRVFDVTDSYGPKEIMGSAYEQMADTTYRLSFHADQLARRRFRVVQDTSFARVPNSNVIPALGTSLVNLRSSTLSADYLVIFYDRFRAAADSLAAWRRDFNGLETYTVPISALYDQFSGGRTDPAAIRNFLRATFLGWKRKPAFVTLLGDASYDFKNYLGLAASGNPGSLVPSYENGFENALLRQYATDDWILSVDPANDEDGAVPDFFGGRIPAPDAASALDVVLNKVLFYERSAPFGEYRNRVMLIADDQEQGDSDDGLHWTHLSQTTKLDTLATPPHMDRHYVYLHTYPDGEASNTKPLAKEDIINTINQDGVALFNYIGHGSPFQMADERVLLDTDVGSMNNAQRLPLFVAASCDVGRFSDPKITSLGERLLLRHGGGAIGVISSTEEAFSGQNAILNTTIYQQMFRRDSVTGQFHVPVSEALLAGKLGDVNSRKYQLMGDAAARLNLPKLWVDLTLFDSTGTGVTDIEQGQHLVFRGRLLDKPDGNPVMLDGVASVLIEDSAPLQQAPPCPLSPGCGTSCQPPEPPDCGQPFYYFKAGSMFRGDVGVTNGAFEGRFVVPLEARRGTKGRVRAYLSGRLTGGNGVTDAVGNLRAPVVQGSASTDDREGPRISLSFAGGSTSVRPDAILNVVLFDPSGILITGHTPQNGIIVTIDDNSTSRVDITPSFRYAADSYQSGSATYQLEDLPPGPHRIRVSAADNLAVGLTAGIHRSSATIDFEVTETPPLRIRTAYLFPNPARSRGGIRGGQFIIDVPGDPVNVLLRIYTVSGRLVRVLKATSGQGQVQIAWDGLDEHANELANGVYLFKVHANARELDGSSSPRLKDTAQGRFVIVNR